MFNQEKLKEVVKLYKEQFPQWWIDEKFKWQAVKYFQENWDINALDFSEMINRTLDANVYYSLFVSANHFPAVMIKGFAEVAPETVRAMFVDLFDESEDVFERIDRFKIKSKDLLQEHGGGAKSHFQDENCITTYLWLRYPEKYYIYKFSEVKDVVSVLDADYKFKKGAYEYNVRNSIKLYDEICEELRKDKELIDMLREAIDDTCDKDLALKTLTFDIGFYVSRKYKEDNAALEGEYWPSLEQYNPNMTKEKWVALLEKEKEPHPSTLKMLKAMVELGGETTCKKLGKVLGVQANSCVLRGANLGKRAKSMYNLAPCLIEGKEYYFAIPFLWKGTVEENQDLAIWKLRPELKAALEELDLPPLEVKPMQTDINQNTILYGPPGTGKTYITARYAVAIVENKPLEEIEKLDYKEVVNRYNEYKSEGRIEFTTFHQSYGYEEFIEGIKPVVNADGNIEYKVEDGLFKKFCKEATNIVNKQNHVFIIDEINRGNISKIFGELITLIEPTKRVGQEEGLKVRLPYSQSLFGVPDNVYIIGTMNTADRSIAAIDTALRRRFAFKEMMPDTDVINEVIIEGVNVADLLSIINKRIEVLYDREHTIGHAYFTSLIENSSKELLFDIFRNKIFPLLQEYFFEDYEKIQLVLGDNQKTEDALKFIIDEKVEYKKYFGSYPFDYEDRKTYMINEAAFNNIEAYKAMLDGTAK